MKVVLLGKWPENRLEGGVAFYTVNILRSLEKIDSVFVHYISFGERSRVLYENSAKITIIGIKKFYYIFPFLAVIRLIKEIEVDRPDVIHVMGSNISPYIWSTLYFRKKTLVILSVLGVLQKEIKFEKFPRKIYMVLNGLNELFFTSMIPVLTVATNSLKDLFVPHTRSKIFIVPSGYTSHQVETEPEDEDIDIFIAARLTNIKGVDILLAAIPAVLKEIPNLKVCIAGNGEEKQNLENLTKKLHITDNVRFLGFIAEEDKHRMYRSCKICVVPSRWDCQPISILEAIAFGKPVIASTASNPEVLEIGKCGLLFNSEDSNDLADKIKILLGDKNLRQDLGRNGKKISKDYDWDVIASKFFDIYRGEILSYTMKINKES